MQLKKDDLIHLIEVLSQAEKKSLTLFLQSLPSGNSIDYIDLFRKLQVKKGIPNIKRLGSSQAQAKAKRRLYDNILKGIRAHHDKKSVDIITQNMLSEIEILHDFNLPDQAMRMLDKAYLLAKKFEKHGLLLQILSWESKLNIVLDKPARSMESIITEEQEVLGKLSQIMLMKSMYNKLKQIKKQQGYSKGNINSNLAKETIYSPDMIRYEECSSQKAKFYFHFIHTIYFWMANEYPKTYEYSKELTKPEMQIIGANDYIDGIVEHVLACVNIVKFEDALKALDLAANFMQSQGLHQSHLLNIKFIYCEINAHLVMYNYMGEAESLKQAIKKTEERFILYGENFSLEMKQVVLGNLMNAYLGTGDFEKMDNLWEKIFSMKSINIRTDIIGDLYFFRLFSILQNEIYEVLPSAALSAYRFYNQSPEFKKRFELELNATAILLRKHDFENIELKIKTLNQLRNIFTDYINKLHNNYQFHEHYSRYVIWISSIINKRAFYEEAAVWYRKLV